MGVTFEYISELKSYDFSHSLLESPLMLSTEKALRYLLDEVVVKIVE